MKPGNPLNPSSVDLTTFTVIKVAGVPLPGECRVEFIDIQRELNRISRATVTLFDGDVAEQNFKMSSYEIKGETLLVPGNTLEIKTGYSGDEQPLFSGTIVKHTIQVKRRGESYLVVECKDPAFKMSLVPHSKYFNDTTDSDLFDEVAGAYPDISLEAEPTSIQFPEIVQYRISDWDLIVARAEKAGLVCLTEDGTLKISALAEIPPDTGILTLSYGRNIFDLDLELNSQFQFPEVKAVGWDMSSQELLEAGETDSPLPEQGNLTRADLAAAAGDPVVELKHSGKLTQEELDTWTLAGIQKSHLSKIRGTIRIQGTDKIKPNQWIKLEGLGDTFNGLAFVSGVRHSLGRGDWITAVQIGMPPDWHFERFNVNPAAGSGFHCPIHGLHIGVVTQLEGDPDGEERILVRLPVIAPENEGIWTRLATLDAGENRGTVARPEIGDEVIVGFVDNDPNQAVVLGMLHSSSKPAPIPASDDNHEKGWVTRSEMKLVFNDDETSMTLQTPGGNSLVISDSEESIVITDQHGNSITLDSNGITLDSASEISLKAAADTKVAGINVEVSADASAKLLAAEVKLGS